MIKNIKMFSGQFFPSGRASDYKTWQSWGSIPPAHLGVIRANHSAPSLGAQPLKSL